MLVYRECTTKRPDSLFSEAHEATAFALAIFYPQNQRSQDPSPQQGGHDRTCFFLLKIVDVAMPLPLSVHKNANKNGRCNIKKSSLDLIDFILRFACWLKVVGKISQNIPHGCWFFRWFAMVESGKKHLKNKNKCKSIGVSWKTSEKYQLGSFPQQIGVKNKKYLSCHHL